jgi:hypothetical protein
MQKSLKVLGIIGIILSVLGILCCFAPDPYGYSTGYVFWLGLNSCFLMALSIVSIVKSKI